MSTAERLAWGVLALWLAVALLAGAEARGGIDLARMFEPPGAGTLLGRDDLGRPLAARIAGGARLSFAVACAVVAVSAALGTAIGLAAGWLGGWWDGVVARLIDVFLAFPGILLAIALAGILGPGIGNVVVALAAVGWTGFARLARAQAHSLRRRDHVLVAEALGSPAPRIVLRHVLPLVAGPLVVEATFGLAAVIVAEAGLSFLGLGVQPPSPSWGALIRDGMRYLLSAPHLVVMPGLALASVVLAINLLGDRLRDRLATPTP